MQIGHHNYYGLADNDLVALLGNGDYTAFKEIYERYNKLLLIYAHRKLKDKEEAKDVVQDVFITIWANKEEVNTVTNLSAYLHRAVLHKVLNVIRHENVCEKNIDNLQRLLTTPNNTTDYLVREKDIAALIEREISHLPQKMREVFKMRVEHHLSNKEIAAQLNLSEHTVATHIKRALSVLKTKFGAHAVLIYLLMR